MFRPGGSTWSFCVGVGSVLSIIPGVTTPIHEVAGFSTSFTAPEWTDATAIYGDWHVVGGDLEAAAEHVGGGLAEAA